MEKLRALTTEYINKITEVSKVCFSSSYIYEMLKTQKIKLINYITETITINLFKKSKEMQGCINLFNKKAKELAEKVNVPFSNIEISVIERNLNENG